MIEQMRFFITLLLASILFSRASMRFKILISSALQTFVRLVPGLVMKNGLFKDTA